MKIKYAAILNLVEEENKLLPLTRRRPVAALPIASRYRLIDFPLSALFNAQVRSAALFISGSGRSLYDHIRAGNTWGLDNMAGGGVFTHSQIRMKAQKVDGSDRFEDNYYHDHRDYLEKSNAKYVVLIGSSILANVQLDSMLQYHLDQESDITVAYKNIPRNEVREDTIFSEYTIDPTNDVVIQHIEPLTNLPYDDTKVAFGMDLLIAEVDVFLSYLERLQNESLLISVKNILNIAIEERNRKISAYEYTGYLKAIEDIPSYFEANMDMLDEDKFNALFFRDSPVLTKSKNSAPTYYGKESIVSNSQFANDCEIYGTVENSVIFRRNTICQNAVVRNTVALQDCFIDEGAELNYVILDKHVYVAKGAKLEGTPENPIVVPKEARVLSSGEIVEGRRI